MPLRFDSAQPLEQTPPFIRWTLAHPCAVRECEDYFDPDRMDRLLRGVRAASDARAEQRVHSGIAVQRNALSSHSVLGFEVAAVLEPLGGEDYVCQLCSGCPANALERLEPRALAGCVGHLVPNAENQTEFHRRFDALCAQFSELTNALPCTSPRWFGLWINPRPSGDEVRWQRELLGQLDDSEGGDLVGLAEYLAALDMHLEHAIPLIARAYPGGRCEERKWYVEPHCGRCKAAWPEARRQQCRVCEQVGGRQPEQRRLRMGTRPYRPLADFLGHEGAAAHIETLGPAEKLEGT